MAAAPEDPITILLDQARSDDQRIAALLPMVYDQLRAAAQRCLRGERKDHTLQATALVHEVWLKLMGPREVPWQNRAHFLTAAVEGMRRVLIDHARSKAALRRGGADARRAAIDLQSLPDPDSAEQNAGFLMLDETIERLATVDADAAKVVRLRYFAGLTLDETAAALGVSSPTVQRTWAFARSWLRDALTADSGES